LANPSSRIAYIDWARGVACLLMFQTHCYDSWLGGSARDTAFFRWTRVGGTLPAPLFLFLAGVAVALVSERAARKGASPPQVAGRVMRRGWQIFGFAMLFRVQEFLLGWPRSPWTDLLRVDILNIIGLSLVLLGAFLSVVWRFDSRVAEMRDGAVRSALGARSGGLAALVAGTIAVVTPPLWTTWRPRWLPWFLESYVNGVHIFDKPQPYLFPLFPWAAFTFAGFAAGCFLVSPWAERHDFRAVVLTACAGGGLIGLGFWLDSRPQFYAEYDFWHSSPEFWLIRVGVLTGGLLVGYLWCRWSPALGGFSPVVELGRQSLLVYWVSVELAYGGLSIFKKSAQDIATASLGLLAVTLAMIALAAFRNRTEGRPFKDWFLWRAPAGAAR
jgi:uncharacterized membrane protein